MYNSDIRYLMSIISVKILNFLLCLVIIQISCYLKVAIKITVDARKINKNVKWNFLFLNRSSVMKIYRYLQIFKFKRSV